MGVQSRFSGRGCWSPRRCWRAVLPSAVSLHGQDQSVAPPQLARTWDAEHVSTPLPPLMDHKEVVRRLTDLTSANPDLFTLEKIGESLEGRSLNYVKTGTGSTGVLLWSQMHGDEPTATAALFDIFEYLRRHREDPMVRRILTRLTLHVVPMLNPDGAERFQRRNAQSIDINRDALRLQTPEGRALKALRDRLNPQVGFNLHNQSWRTSVGTPPKPASISLLSVAYDEARTENAGRKLTKKICAVIREALEPLASGQIGRYDDEFEVRAFGDNITLWGTPVVLIETGPMAVRGARRGARAPEFRGDSLSARRDGNRPRGQGGPEALRRAPDEREQDALRSDPERHRDQWRRDSTVHRRHRSSRHPTRSDRRGPPRSPDGRGDRRHRRSPNARRAQDDRRDERRPSCRSSTRS